MPCGFSLVHFLHILFHQQNHIKQAHFSSQEWSDGTVSQALGNQTSSHALPALTPLLPWEVCVGPALGQILWPEACRHPVLGQLYWTVASFPSETAEIRHGLSTRKSVSKRHSRKLGRKPKFSVGLGKHIPE
jgi:hypothetical protein